MSNKDAVSCNAAEGGGNGNDLTEPLLPPPLEPPLEAGAEEEDTLTGNGTDERFSDEDKGGGDEDDAAITDRPVTVPRGTEGAPPPPVVASHLDPLPAIVAARLAAIFPR